MTHSFFLLKGEVPVCISCDKLLTIEHILLFCSDLIEVVEWNVTAWSVRMFSDMFRLHFQLCERDQFFFESYNFRLLFLAIPQVEFMYLVFTHMLHESYCRQLRSLLCSCDDFTC